MLVSVYTLGCKVNECEGRSIMEELSSLGYQTTEEIIPCADYYVLNTCSVTAEADRKCRQTIGKIISASSNAKILVCGCSSQFNQEFYNNCDNVIYITGSGCKRKIVEVIKNGVSEIKNDVGVIPTTYEKMCIPSHYSTRDFIKIQDGCNNFCSYCLIPYVRGRERSRSIHEILNEVEIASKRTKEVVLTGINISSYGKDIGLTLADLCEKLKSYDIRKRIGSFECNAITDQLLKAMKEGNFCDHFHLSLQSGSSEILKKMNRHYTPSQYKDKVNLIRSYFPNAGITTDVITGFPGETEVLFNETCQFVKEIGFSDIHIFPYSERKGTNAAKLMQVDKKIRKDRAAKLSVIRDELKTKFLKTQLGKNLNVYFETQDDGISVGYATNYVKVYSKENSVNVTKNVEITKLYKKGVM